jgi:hypothetical protein
MSLKAGEMRTMVGFALHSLETHGGSKVFGKDLLNAGRSLVDFISAAGSPGAMPTLQQMSDIRGCYDLHLRSCVASGIDLSPKHHLTCHLIERTVGFQK